MSFASETRRTAPRRLVAVTLGSALWLLLASSSVSAQCVSLTTLGSPSTQDFTTLANAGTGVVWTDNTTIAGWYSTRTTYNAATGSSNAGSLYSFGVAGANPLTDRALGGIGSGGTGTFYWAACFTNNTGSALSSVDIAYVGEQWRDGGAATPVAHVMAVEYQVAAAGTITDADTPSSGWTAHVALDFTSPTFTNTGTGVLIDGNASANRTARTSSIAVGVPVGNQFWIRWRDLNDGGNDHALSIDDFSLTPQGGGTALDIGDVTLVEGNPPGTTTFTFAVTLTAPAGPGGVTFDIATADGTAQDDNPIAEDDDYVAQSLTGQNIPMGSVGPYNFNVTVNRDATPEPNETFFVNVTNIVGAGPGDVQGQGTIDNDDVAIVFMHDVQGNGAATPIPGATVTIEGVVTGDYQPIPNDNRLSGFFVQEENFEVDADPNTSEGLFVFCSACPTNVAEGQRVQATGVVSEFNGFTQIAATTAGAVVITNAGNNLAQVSPATIDLPVVGVIDDFYEPREAMLVTFVDLLTVSEYFEQARFGRIELFEGGRPRAYTESSPPSVAGFSAHNDDLARRRVFLDDDDNVENSVLGLPNGQQFVFHPQANGGLSVGTQGTDFFRGGDVVNGLTGILHYSFSGGASPNEWRVRPVAASPAAFTVANPRPAAPPVVGGAVRAASVDALNYFTTLDVLGADSAAELNRQRERASIVLCALNADVAALTGIENHPANASITDLLGDTNTRCGGAHPYTFVDTGGALGIDPTRVQLIYRTGVVSPVGAPLADTDPSHIRPPTAQTFDVVDAVNPAFGQRFTAVANHATPKGCAGAAGADLDQGDGQGCFAATRLAQANRLLAWINGTVIPAAGDPDVLMLGDFGAYPQETSATTLAGAGYSDLENAFSGAAAYSFLFAGQLGHIDYAWSNASLTPQITGAATWHINADENPLFDYSDEIDDGAAEAAFEEKPDGSALVPPRVLFQPASAARASSQDPVLLGIFAISDIVLTKTDSPDPVVAGSNLTYTITVTNNGPDPATDAAWNDTLPAGTTFVSLPAVAGWSCTTPAVGAGGAVSCSNPSFAVGSAVFTLTVNVDASTVAGTVLSNTATATSSSAEGNPGDESDTETTTVTTAADLQLSKTDSPDPVTAGANLSYQITLANNGPSTAASVTFSDPLPAGTTFVSLSTTGPWSCTTPAVGASGTVTCTNAAFAAGTDFFTLVVNVDAGVASGSVISNTAALTSATPDPVPGNESDTATTTVSTSADLQISKTDTPDPVNAGANLTYQITLTNNGPSNAGSATFSDPLPAGTAFVSLSTTGSWSCTTPAVGATGTVTCSNASVGVSVDFFTLVVNVDPAAAAGTILTNTATVSSSTPDPNGANNSATATTTVAASADLSVTKTDAPDPVTAGTNLTYTITVDNAGPSMASAVSLDDTVPVGTTFVSLTTPAGWSCTTPAVGGTGAVACSNASVGIGSAAFTLVVAVDPGLADGTVISNTATVVSFGTPDPNSGNQSATATTTVGSGSADLSVTKTDTPDPVAPGTNLTYTITANNAGPSAATSATLSDTLPVGTTFVSFASPGGWSCTTPAVGASGNVACSIAAFGVGSAAFTLVVAVDPALAPGTVISNTATIASATLDPNPGNESATATTTVGSGSADLSVTKTDTPDPVTAGANLTYAITASNAGPSAASNTTLSDALPAGTTFVSLSSPGGWSCTTPAVGTSGNVTCSIASFGVGPAAFTLVVAVDAGVASGTVITNTATVASATLDPNPGNESATATTTVGSGSADLSVTKTDTPDPVTAGANLTYTITASNAGPSAASNATLSDALPAGTTFVSLSSPGGWSCTTPAVGTSGNVTCSIASFGVGPAAFTLVVAVDAGVASGTVITNTATVASATADPNPGNDSATATTTVGNGSADLSVVKIDTPDPVAPGTNLTYTITATNAGPSAAGTATLTDPLPAGTTFVSLSSPGGWTCTTPAVGGTGSVTCSVASFAVGNAAFTLVVAVDAGLAGGTIISNTATVASATSDPNPGNDAATATTTVSSGSADLSVTQTDTPDPVAAGGNLSYAITVNNAGPGAAANAALSDTLPAGTTFVSLTSAAGWSCTTPAVGASGVVTCTNAAFAVGSAAFTLVVAVDAATAGGTVIGNTATVSSATGDPTPGNNTATAISTVNAPTIVSGTKTVGGAASPGGSITYSIVLSNTGSATQGDNASDEFTDVLPAGLSLVSASASSGTALANVGSNTVTWNGSIAGGAAVTITIQATVGAAVAPGTSIMNQGTIRFDADGNGSNEATALTDDPGTGAASDGTSFIVAQVALLRPAVIPATSLPINALLAALLALVALVAVRRRAG